MNPSPKWFQRALPFLSWFPLPRGSLRADLIAGVSVGLVLVPQSMAYAQLAGLPAYYGLYAAFLPVLVGALWGSSSQLATGPVAMVSILTGATLANFAAPATEQFIALAITLSLLVGIMQFALGVLRLGAIVSFLSHPAIVGFTNAAATIIALSQLDKLLGVSAQRSGSYMRDIGNVLAQLGDAHFPTVAMGMGAIAIMAVLRRFAPKIPAVLVAVAICTSISWATGFSTSGKVVGEVPRGLPSVGLPALSFETLSMCLTAALVITLVGFMEAISIAKAMATKTRQRIDPNQELIGQGLANLVGAFTQSYPVSGSFSRSAVNLAAGAVTGMSSVFTALVVLVTLLFLTSALYHLPHAVLAAIIMMAVVGLINFGAIKHAWQAHRHDGICAIVTFIATLAFAPHLDLGILLGGGLAIVMFLYRTMSPRVNVRVHEGSGTVPPVLSIHFDGRLYFANVPYFEDAVLNAASSHPAARTILVDGRAINEIDASGEEVLRHLHRHLRDNDTRMVFAELKPQVIEVMRATGLHDVIGDGAFFGSEQAALAELLQSGDKP